MITKSCSSPSDDSNFSADSNLNAALVEIGTAGTIATLATQVSALGIGQVMVATVGASAVVVSLPAVVAVCATGCLGLSLGKKIVDTINKP